MMGPIDEQELLARFRRWLDDARLEPVEPPSAGVEENGEAEHEQVGLYRMVEEFTALRHELKLQTRGARSQQEQGETLLLGLRQAIDQFRSVEPKEAEAAWRAGKGLAGILADLDEALDRGRVQIEKAAQRWAVLEAEAVQARAADLDALFARQSWFRRWRLRSYHEQIRRLSIEREEPVRRDLFDALIEGYALIQSRLARGLVAERVERIACLGEPVDPERMIVIEVVDAAGAPPGLVVDEIRRGYTWRGRLLRPAEVRASRST